MNQKGRKSFVFSLFIIALAAISSGCVAYQPSARHMTVVAETPGIDKPAKGKSMVVFMRPSKLGYAVHSSVFDVKDEKPSVVGLVGFRTKYAYQTDPGEHLFMVIGENADFMSADLLPDKTYYAFVTPRMGAWKARFSLRPPTDLEISSGSLMQWLNAAVWLNKTSNADLWAEQNMPDIKRKLAGYYARWITKPEADRPKLGPDSGLID